MFYVFNKEKISSYIILVSTVIILFGLAVSLKENKVVETSVNIESEINSIINTFDR